MPEPRRPRLRVGKERLSYRRKQDDLHATALVPEAIALDTDVRWRERLLLMLLLSYDHRRQRKVWPSQQTLAGALRVTERRLRALLEALEDRECIAIHRGSRNNAYELLHPAWPPRGGYFIQVPNRVLRVSRVPTAERFLYILLLRYDPRGTRKVWPRQSELADAMGVTTRHVRDLLKHLQHRGWIRITREKGNLYELLGPSRPGRTARRT